MTEQKIKIGNFIEPMLVSESGASQTKFTEIIKRHKGTTFAEIKYDGYRIQVHKNKDVNLFTRNSNPLNPLVFPDLAKDLQNLPDGIYDGELVGYGSSLEGFNSVKKRVRNELDESLVEKFPLQIKFFDILQLERKSLLQKTLNQRRKYLEDNCENYSDQFSISDPLMLKTKFIEASSNKLEGLVCKNPDSLYLPGSRTKDWIKLKNFSTLDLAVLGIYQGEGKASSLPFAALLLGTNNNGKYETISKVGISNKEMISSLYDRIKSSLVKDVPDNLVLSPSIYNKTYSRKLPFRYTNSKELPLVEVEFLNITKSNNWHSCGLSDGMAYSLRIATLKNLRFDKSTKDCNTTQQVAELYSE